MNARIMRQRWIFSGLKQQRGVAMVEFAIVAPLLFVLLFGIIEFGIILYDQAVITNASREGARYAAMYYVDPTTGEATRDACPAVQNYVVEYVNARVINLTNTNAIGTGNVTCPNGTPYYDPSATTGYVDTVSVQYTYNFLVFGGLMRLLGGSISPTLNLSATTVMRDENQNP